jgi:hypothetical protein
MVRLEFSRELLLVGVSAAHDAHNSVALFVTKFQDHVTSATVESPGPRRARNWFTELKFNQAWLAQS